jgi:hypothetical protein
MIKLLFDYFDYYTSFISSFTLCSPFPLSNHTYKYVSTGFRVFVVPEAATVLFLNGASPDDFSKAGCAFAFQQFVIKYVTAQ